MGAKLMGANLSGANLSAASLAIADLGGANLSGANLPEFDSSRHFRKSALNEINNLEAIFTFYCGGTFL
jgi:uncharacterized protein YjbI with pentapeptide repeats